MEIRLQKTLVAPNNWAISVQWGTTLTKIATDGSLYTEWKQSGSRGFNIVLNPDGTLSLYGCDPDTGKVLIPYLNILLRNPSPNVTAALSAIQPQLAIEAGRYV